MALKGSFNKAAFDKAAAQVIQNQLEAAYDVLDYVGGECVREARLNGDYKNITGNLRNSIGYVVMHKGQVVRSNFETTVNGEKSSDINPIEKGKSLAVEVGSGFGNNVVLVLVAGMHYATYVESKGRNVLTSAEQLAKQELPRMMKEVFG